MTTAKTAKTVPAAAEFRSVSKVYGRFAALRSLSATFAAGSCTVIVGANGAGKSTLLRLAAGLVSPTRGEVRVFDTRPQEQRGRVAYMSHAPMLYDELSAMENLRYFGSLGKSKACDCSGSPEMALRAVGLDPALKRPVGEYSQGMRQRTSFARVLQSDPELLLLDEPFSNMDAASVKQMVELLGDFRSWAVEGGGTRTIVLTTHQLQLAMPLADSVVSLKDGEMAAVEAAEGVS
ncbi:MAG: ABC transporter ATP-binding protein [Acidobacteriaceae bacterium]